MGVQIPDEVKKYFWGDNLSDLSWPKHKQYITQTILEKGDRLSINWLFTVISRSEVKDLLPKLRLPVKSSNFWHTYLS
jgi:hypothetical protein